MVAGGYDGYPRFTLLLLTHVQLPELAVRARVALQLRLDCIRYTSTSSTSAQSHQSNRAAVAMGDRKMW